MTEASDTIAHSISVFSAFWRCIFLLVFILFYFSHSRRRVSLIIPVSPFLFLPIFQFSSNVFLAIMSSQSTFSRLRLYRNWLYSHPTVPMRLLPIVFIPHGPSPPPMQMTVRIVEGRRSPRVGLCERVAEAFKIFISETAFGWFYRAIDDTWISPPTLLEFVSDQSMQDSP
jgi:hypothetical protein